MLYCPHLYLPLLLATSVWAQETITMTAISQKPINTDTDILAFGSDGDGRDVTLVSAKSGAVLGAALQNPRLIIWENGSIKHEYPVPGLLPHPVAVGSSHLFFTSSAPTTGPIRQAGGAQVMEIASGRTVTIFDDLRPYAAAFGGNGLVVVGVSAAGSPELRTFSGPNFATRTAYPLPPGLLKGPLLQILSIGPNNSAVILNMVEASFTVLDLSGGTLKIGSSRQLGGREIAKSREWPGGSGRPNFRRGLVMAQAPSAKGGIVALLVPYKREDGGFRVTEYDATGSEVKSWRLAIEDSVARVDFRPSTVAWTADEIIIFTPNGLKRCYRRPS